MSKFSLMLEADSAAEMLQMIAEAHVEWGGKQQIAPPPAPVYPLPVANKAPEAPVAEATKEEPKVRKQRKSNKAESVADTPAPAVQEAVAEEVEEKSVISASSLKAEVAAEAPIDPFSEEAPPAKTYTFQEIRDALKNVVDKKGMQTAVDICKAFGAERVTAVKEEHYTNFMAKVQEALA